MLSMSAGLKLNFQLMIVSLVACKELFREAHGVSGSLNHLPSCQVLCFCSLVHSQFEKYLKFLPFKVKRTL